MVERDKLAVLSFRDVMHSMVTVVKNTVTYMGKLLRVDLNVTTFCNYVR